MLVGNLGALVRRGKTFALSSCLKGWSPSLRASNEQYSLLRSLRSSAYGNSPISGYSPFRGFKFMSKNLNVPSTRKMTTPVAVLHSAKAEAANSGIKLLVGPHARKQVLVWFLVCNVMVFFMIQLGGDTHLTRSAVSTTDWKFMRLLTDDEWNDKFEKYMQSPGYKCVETLSEFKHIHWAEYAHRQLGIGLGVVFCLPFAYFLSKGYITRPLGLRLSLLFALGGAIGLFGCLPNVKSGPEEPASKNAQLRASPYRYAMHITSALILYGGILWNALSVKEPEPPTGSLEWVRGAAKLRKLVLPVCALVGITALSGAFVAEDRAGRAFNTFPKTGDTLVLDGIFDVKPFFRSFFENTSTVQLNHRILAITTLLSITGLYWTTRRIELHPVIKRRIVETLFIAPFQAMMGVHGFSDQVSFLPGSIHQTFTLILLAFVINLAHLVRKPSPHVLKSLTSLPSIKS